MNRLLKTFGCFVLSMAVTLPAMAADYDLVIKNGRVMDPETCRAIILSSSAMTPKTHPTSISIRGISSAKLWAMFPSRIKMAS